VHSSESGSTISRAEDHSEEPLVRESHVDEDETKEERVLAEGSLK